MKKTGSALLLALLVAACGNETQTTSGTAYLEKHVAAPAAAGSFEDALQKAAKVEPTLVFPARIGIARIDGGRLSGVPGIEMEAWMSVAASLGKDFGEFVPLNPMVAEMVAESVAMDDKNARFQTMNKIRLGAARQHLDAVLVYETYSKTDSKSNLLAISDLTIIGGFLLPSQSRSVEAFANATLLDVMQGYPYGSARVTIDKEEELSSRWGWGSERKKEMGDEARTKAALKLSEETETMFRKLRAELEATRTKTEGNV